MLWDWSLWDDYDIELLESEVYRMIMIYSALRVCLVQRSIMQGLLTHGLLMQRLVMQGFTMHGLVFIKRLVHFVSPSLMSKTLEKISFLLYP